MMNITIITILLPYPLDSGGAQAQYNMIEYLRYKHNITLIYPENQHNNKKTRKELQKRWHNVNLYAYPFTSQIQQPPFFFSKVYPIAIDFKLIEHYSHTDMIYPITLSDLFTT